MVLNKYIDIKNTKDQIICDLVLKIDMLFSCLSTSFLLFHYFVPKTHVTTAMAAAIPTKSAKRPTLTASPIFLMPTAPK